MRTVKRESEKLNKGKYQAIEAVARAFADDKQAHLNFYQQGTIFPESASFRERRNSLKQTDHHQSTPLSVHASDLAVKEAFEAELKYWAAIAADIHPRINKCEWTKEQRIYAYWLLNDESRFSKLILDRAPVEKKSHLTEVERRQVQNYIRRRARRVMKARPRVKVVRSFVLDSSLYSVTGTMTGQAISISTLEKGKRLLIPLKGESGISGNIRIVLVPESRSVEVHTTFAVNAPVIKSNEVIALDVGLTETFVDDAGNHYGTESGPMMRQATRQLNDKGQKRNKLHADEKKYKNEGQKAKAKNIRKFNLGTKRLDKRRKKTRITIANQVNRAINQVIETRQPGVIIVEKLDFRGPAQSREISRRVSNWQRTTLKERIEFKASAAGCRREQVNPAYTSQTCPLCGFVDKLNRKGDVFQCLKCRHAGHADHTAAINQKIRYFDKRISVYTPKQQVKALLDTDHKARLENRTADDACTVTVPGRTLRRGRPRQTKNETVAGKQTKPATFK